MNKHDARAPRGALPATAPDGDIEGERRLPCAVLAPFVHHFWFMRWRLRAPFTGEALPHPAVSLLVVEDEGGQRAEVVGAHTGRLARRLKGVGQVFGVAFRPAMSQPLLRGSIARITNRVVPLEQVLGPEVRAWVRALSAEPDLDGRIALARTFLAPRLTPVEPQVAPLRDLVERIASDRSLVRVEGVGAVAGLDARTLQRRFERYVGVTPKAVIQRYRLHEAVEQLRRGEPPDLAALAATLGYADQAHFTRDFKLVVGKTPLSFARLRSSRAVTIRQGSG